MTDTYPIRVAGMDVDLARVPRSGKATPAGEFNLRLLPRTASKRGTRDSVITQTPREADAAS